MADPISIGASVLGLVGAAQKVGGLLHSFGSRMVNSADSVNKLHREIESITAVFRALGALVFQKQAQDIIRLPPSSFRPVLEALLTSVTGCVLVFSELEKLLDEVGGVKTLWKRAKWARKEEAVRDLQAHLERHKATLNLALSALNMAQSEQRHVQILREIRVLQAAVTRRDDHIIRLSSIMSREDATDISIIETSTIAKSTSYSKTQFTGENASIKSFRSTISVSTICKPVRHAFESILRGTRVYKGKVWGSTVSLSSNVTRCTKWTNITAVSKISNLSVFELLLVSDIYNAKHYLSIQVKTTAKGSENKSLKIPDLEPKHSPLLLNLSPSHLLSSRDDHETPSPPFGEAASEILRPRNPLRNLDPPLLYLSPSHLLYLQDDSKTPLPPLGEALPEMFPPGHPLRTLYSPYLNLSPSHSFSSGDDCNTILLSSGEATSVIFRPRNPLRRRSVEPSSPQGS